MEKPTAEVIELKEINGANHEFSTEICESGTNNNAKFITKFLRSVLIPVDDLESGKRAIQHYLEECRKPKDKLFLFHSVHLDPTSNIGGTSGLFHSEQLRRQVMKKKGEIQVLQDNLEKFLSDKEVTATFYAKDGERAGANIIRFAKEKAVNLIIMASKEQSRIMNAVVGQTSDYVLKHSCGITVTVVPAPLPDLRAGRRPRMDSDTSCPGDLTFGHRRRALHFFKPTRRRLHSEPSALKMHNIADENEEEATEEHTDAAPGA